MKAGQDEYFAVIGEGAALLISLDEKSSGFFGSLNRLREILAILGYSSAVKPLAFSLADKDGSLAALSDYLNNGMKLVPAALAPFELLTMYDLTILAGGNTGPLSEGLWEYQNQLGVQAGSPEAKRAAFEHFASRGVKHGIEQSVLEQAVADAAALLQKQPVDDPDYMKARTEYESITRERKDVLTALAALIASDSADIDTLVKQRDALWKKYDDEQTAAYLRVEQLRTKFYAERAEKHRALLEGNGTAILAKIAEASPITQEQADAWAAEQIIDPSTKAKLKKLGYPPEDVVRDMAEYYRLTGGKASAIRISTDGGKRANAVGITERLGEKIINIGSRFNKTVLWHELAHHLEGDPVARGASNGFLLKRREGEGVYRLRDLTGNKAYGKDEVAYKDHFMDFYVGKYYKGDITEVWSMGVQYLANPKDAANFAAKDPEMFALITGYLTSPLTQAMDAKLNMHKGAISDAIEKKQNEDELFDKAIQYLAKQVKIVKDDWFDSLDRSGRLYLDIDWYVISRSKKGPVEYIGSSVNYRVFSGVVRNPVTKRNAKGYIIVDINHVSRAETITGGQELAQAMIAAANHDGTSLSDVRYGYFLEGWAADRKKKIINMVGMENLE